LTPLQFPLLALGWEVKKKKNEKQTGLAFILCEGCLEFWPFPLLDLDLWVDDQILGSWERQGRNSSLWSGDGRDGRSCLKDEGLGKDGMMEEGEKKITCVHNLSWDLLLFFFLDVSLFSSLSLLLPCLSRLWISGSYLCLSWGSTLVLTLIEGLIERKKVDPE
jgi:hypothetical protein